MRVVKFLRVPFVAAVCMIALCAGSVKSDEMWTETGAPILNWVSLASSADGMFLAGATGWPDGFLYVSTNAARTWTQAVAPSFIWKSVAASANGGLIFAVNGPNAVFVFTNSGQYADLRPSCTAPVTAIACSADGSKLVAAGSSATSGSLLCFSTNSAMNWSTAIGPLMPWRSLAASADGSTFMAAAGGWGLPDGVFVSRNSGATWTNTGLPRGDWRTVACSVDGRRMYAAGDRVFASSDRGYSWKSLAVAGSFSGAYVACSADGSRVALAVNGDPGTSGGGVFLSADYGQNWSSNALPWFTVNALAFSADGGALVLAGGGESPLSGGIYRHEWPAVPKLTIELRGPSVTLSWGIPSTGYSLQRAAALEPAVWENVPVVPRLDASSLRYVVSLPRSDATAFYRLLPVSDL